MRETRILAGWYQVSNGEYFGNVRRGREYDGELKSKWYADIRKSSTGDLVRYAGIWDSKRDAVEEVTHILNTRYYRRYRGIWRWYFRQEHY